MRFRFVTLALAVLVAACGKKKPEPGPLPNPGPTTPTTPPPAPPPPAPPSTDPNAAERERAELTRVLMEAIYFDYNEDVIRADARATLEQKAAILLANAGVRVRISGHADERGSDEYNLVLGTRRATAAKRFFEAKGIDGSRVEVVSFGEERPADRAATESAWAKNRRDEFQLLAGADRLVKPQ